MTSLSFARAALTIFPEIEMDIVNNDFDYERAFAVNVAADRYPMFAAYATERRLFERFTPEKVAQIRATFEQWHTVISYPEAVLT